MIMNCTNQKVVIQLTRYQHLTSYQPKLNQYWRHTFIMFVYFRAWFSFQHVIFQWSSWFGLHQDKLYRICQVSFDLCLTIYKSCVFFSPVAFNYYCFQGKLIVNSQLVLFWVSSETLPIKSIIKCIERTKVKQPLLNKPRHYSFVTQVNMSLRP